MPNSQVQRNLLATGSTLERALALCKTKWGTETEKGDKLTFLFLNGCMESRSHHAAVHRQDAAGRPSRLIRREIDGGLGDLRRLSQPTHRMCPFEPGLGLWILQHGCDGWGDDPGWADGVAPDVLLRVVHRHRLGEHDDTRLGRLVGMALKAEDGLEPGNRGDIQDRAASLLQHLGNCRANEAERALHEHVERLIPNVIGGLVEPPGMEQVARVVDENVEAAEGPDSGRHRLLHVLFVGHAARERQGLSALPLNLSDNALQLVLPPAGDRDLRTFPSKDLRNRFADAGPTTGHNRYLVFESHGCVLLGCRVLLSVTRRAVKRERRKPSGSAFLSHCIPNATWLRLSILPPPLTLSARPRIVHITTPPPAWMFRPVSQRASSLTTKATTSAMSFGVPSRLSGEACSPVWRKAGSAGIMAVSVNPGDTVFTVIPLGASSCARPFVNCSRAPLLPR